MPGKTFDPGNCLLAVALCRGDDEVGAVEDGRVGVLHPIDFASGHRVGGDELQVRSQDGLDFRYYPALHSRNVADYRSAAQPLLVLAHPLLENMGIERAYHHIPASQPFRVDFGSAAADNALLQSEVYARAAACQRTHFEACASKPFRIGASYQSQPDYQNPIHSSAK